MFSHKHTLLKIPPLVIDNKVYVLTKKSMQRLIVNIAQFQMYVNIQF